jgi:hypothetical protein
MYIYLYICIYIYIHIYICIYVYIHVYKGYQCDTTERLQQQSIAKIISMDICSEIEWYKGKIYIYIYIHLCMYIDISIYA